jgi:lactoylglutathione lyase
MENVKNSILRINIRYRRAAHIQAGSITLRIFIISCSALIKKKCARDASIWPLVLYAEGINRQQLVNDLIFAHTSIRTSNMDRSIDFYTRLMGLRLLGRQEIRQNNAEIAFLQDPDGRGAKLELTFYRNQKKFIQPEYEDRLFDHIALEISDMKQTITMLQSEKVTITDEPFRLGPTGPLIAFVEDPDGTLIELIERK